MPKKTKYPKLRSYVKKGVNGQRWVSFWYDMRGSGEKDISLGTDYAKAIERWDEIHNKRKRIAGTLEEAFTAWERDELPTRQKETARGYAKSLKIIRPVFGEARWDQITLKVLKDYLRKRTAKTQANREVALLSVIWNWARTEDLTKIPYPAHDMKRAKWMNAEAPREREIGDEAFAAIYLHADPVLRDAMDISTATGLRVRDALGLRLSDVRGSRLVVAASKTRKRGEFDIDASPVLQRVIEARRLNKTAEHLFLLAHGRKPVTERMLRDRFNLARAEAAKEHPECASLVLRDMRKRAGQLAGSVQEASALLQHSSLSVTRKHYTGGEKLKPVR
jgi:site-specific recombinase XerD